MPLANFLAPLRGAQPQRDRRILELQMNLGREGPVSGFRIDLSKGSGVDIQVWIIENGMVEHVLGIHAESQVHGLPDPDALLHIGIEGPEPRSVDGADAQRAAPS